MEILTIEAIFSSGNGFGNKFNVFATIAHPLANAQLGAFAALDDPVNHHPAGLDLGVGKTADGLDAIRWWREGKLAEIAEYCCFDVKVTRLVHEFGRDQKHLMFLDRFQQKRRGDVDWK